MPRQKHTPMRVAILTALAQKSTPISILELQSLVLGHSRSALWESINTMSELCWVDRLGDEGGSCRRGPKPVVHWQITAIGREMLAKGCPHDSPAKPYVGTVATRRVVRVLYAPAYVPSPWVLPRADAQDFRQHQRNPYASQKGVTP